MTRPARPASSLAVAALLAMACASHEPRTPRPAHDQELPVRRDDVQPDPPTPTPTPTRWGVQIGGRGAEIEFASAFAPDGTTYVIVETNDCVTATASTAELCSEAAPDGSKRMRVFVRIATNGRVERFIDPEWKHMFPLDLVVRPGGELLAIARDHREAHHLLRLDRDGKLLAKIPWRPGEQPDFLAIVGDEVFVTGKVEEAVVIAKGITRREPREEANVFLTRLDRDLRPRWSHVLQGDHRKYSGHDWPTSIATTSDGGVVVTGECRAETFGPETGDVEPLECGSLASSDVFFAKWSATGSIQWLRSLRGSADRKSSYSFGTLPGDVVGTADGGVAFTLRHDGTMKVGTGKHDDVTSHGWQDIVVGALDGEGRVVWWHPIGGPGMDDAQQIVFDGERVWTIVTGPLERTDLDPVRITGKPKHTGEGIRRIPTSWLLGYDRNGTRVVTRDLYRRSGSEMRIAGLGVGEGGLRVVTEYSGEIEVSADGEQRIFDARGSSTPDDVLVEGLPLAR